MMNLFYAGNPVLMGLITLIGLYMIWQVYEFFTGSKESGDHSIKVVTTGAAAFLVGMIGQSVGIVNLLGTIEQAREVPPELIVSGLKNTFIPLIYGSMWMLAALVFKGYSGYNNKR